MKLEATNKPEPEAKPAARSPGKRRTEWLKLRVTPGEKVLIEENATAAGQPVSAFLRRLGMGNTVLAASSSPAALRSERDDDFEPRVRELAKTMPRRNAELAARRKEAREKARAALASV
jgi:hypothetical protein